MPRKVRRMRGKGILDLLGLGRAAPKRKRKVGGARKRRKVHRMRGKGFFDKLKNIASGVGRFIKDNQLVSKAANAAGFSKVGALAGKLGLGRRRRRYRGGYSLSVIPNSRMLLGRGTVPGLYL